MPTDNRAAVIGIAAAAIVGLIGKKVVDRSLVNEFVRDMDDPGVANLRTSTLVKLAKMYFQVIAK